MANTTAPASNGKVFKPLAVAGTTTKQQVAHLTAWLNSVANGQGQHVTIKLLPNCTGPHPLPYTNMGVSPGTAAGKRAQINWALFNGFIVVKGQKVATNTVAGFNLYCKSFGVSGYIDLLAALNGGYSPSAKASWGKPFVQLVYTGPAPKQASKAPSKATNGNGKAPAPVAPPAPPAPPAAPPAPLVAANN